MKDFLNEDFLLDNEISKHLFHDYAKNMPIIDYHCHISQKEIYEDIKFKNITHLWLYGDHYKWRQMRTNGVDEKYITGDASDKEKFFKWVETLEKLIGNPLYHWSHLEMQRYFDYKKPLTKENAEEVWNVCNEKLQSDDFSVRNIIKKSNVKVICTTDDPVDNLEYHQKLKKSFDVKVLPAFRPDKAINIENDTFIPYIEKLSEVCNKKVTSFKLLKEALEERLKYFKENGANVSDHGIDYVACEPYTESEVDIIFAKGLENEKLEQKEIAKYKTAIMIFLGKLYYDNDFILQLHYGAKRNNNTFMYNKMGADTGYDSINNYAPASELANYLDALKTNNTLPKTIIYSLNPCDNAVIGSTIGCFQGEGIKGKIQHGSAWWFNDHKTGMIEQMTSLANLGMLSNFVGMLTDSRSFISYTRHEYFRRILCNLIGTWVYNGEYPNDERLLKEIIEGICFNNANEYFGFKF